jgi:hypothetical protein
MRELAMKRGYDIIIVVGFNLKSNWSICKWFTRNRKNADLGDWFARRMCENLAVAEGHDEGNTD